MLRQVVGALPDSQLQGLLVGLDRADDAAVYQISDERAIVATIDVITPIVDDPALFGAIAAANAFSDVFAMGARPLISLSFLSSVTELPVEMLQAILQGAGNFALHNGAPIVGGHSVEGKDLLLGLVVVGEVHPQKIWTKSGAQPGDRLYLTKPLGTGTLTTAVKRGVRPLGDIQDALDGMAKSNGMASSIARGRTIHGATDITGFGLTGHLAEMSHHSGTRFVLNRDKLPGYPHAKLSLDDGIVTRGNARNETYARDLVEVRGEIPPLALDPQTSGGLVFALDADEGKALETDFGSRGEALWHIGNVESGTGLEFI